MHSSATWPPYRIAIWGVLAIVALALRGPGFVRSMKPPEGRFADFFQEWASARNYQSGLPVYSDQRETLPKYTGYQAAKVEVTIPWNAHPPASILLALPFASLDYRDAHLAWNLAMLPLLAASFFLIIRSLALPFSGWSVLPTIALAICCFPLISQFIYGQLNPVLILLITAAWSLDRHNRSGLAGIALGAAAALKLFPAFLFLYFLARRKWAALVPGCLSFVVLNGFALALFGADAFGTYVTTVLPTLQNYQSSWNNFSLTGFWLKLFDPQEHERVVPALRSSTAAHVAIYFTQAAVVVMTAWACWKSTKSGKTDEAFAVCLVGMLLVSPITWNHYFLLLAMPLALLWRDLCGIARWCYWAIVVLIWVPVGWIYLIGIGKEAARKWDTSKHDLAAATPWQNLLVLSLPTYCLLALFILCLTRCFSSRAATVRTKSEPATITA
jgi:hypothetical protein